MEGKERHNYARNFVKTAANITTMATLRHIWVVRGRHQTIFHSDFAHLTMLQSNFLTSLRMTEYMHPATPSWLKAKNFNTDSTLRYLSHLILPLILVLSSTTSLLWIILSLKDKIVDTRSIIIIFTYLGVLFVLEILVLVIWYSRGSKSVADTENQLGQISTNVSVENRSESGSMQSLDEHGERRVFVRDPAGCRWV